MLLKSPQLDSILTPKSVNPTDVVNDINSHIDKNSCEYLSVDISFMNVIDACYVTTLCATKHFTKYPNGKINWKVSSKSVKEFNKDLDLGNNCYIL
ncbi:MAG: hypothetical protein E7Z92_02050 [Cyanobacteria bacterium SIG31]|nr:hypothetical protein [Cyanobacteria bacterium SIG31]